MRLALPSAPGPPEGDTKIRILLPNPYRDFFVS